MSVLRRVEVLTALDKLFVILHKILKMKKSRIDKQFCKRYHVHGVAKNGGGCFLNSRETVSFAPSMRGGDAMYLTLTELIAVLILLILFAQYIQGQKIARRAIPVRRSR